MDDFFEEILQLYLNSDLLSRKNINMHVYERRRGKLDKLFNRAKEKQDYEGDTARRQEFEGFGGSSSHARDSRHVLVWLCGWPVCASSQCAFTLPLQGPQVSPDTFTDHLQRTHSPTLAEIAPESSHLFPSTAKASHSFVSSRRFLKLACGPIMHDFIFLCFPPPLFTDLSVQKPPQENMKWL